jgi:NAD(P)-dependent dehydrogenase (short-subunit alcohol dehydrogenase family)
MEKAAAIIGSNSPLGLAIAENCKHQGFSLASVAVSEDVKASRKNGSFTISWNTRSPLSASTVVRSISNQFGQIQDIYIIYTPGVENRAFHDLPSSAIETIVDDQVKGYTFLLRELFALTRKKKNIFLHCIVYTGGSEILAPQDAAALGYIRSLISSLFTFYQNEDILFNGFESSSPDHDAFAAYIQKQTGDAKSKTNRKWFRFQEKSNLFDPFRKSKT